MTSKLKRNILITLILILIKSIVLIYDLITLPIYFVLQRPWIERRKSSAVRAKQLDPSDPKSPWIRIGDPPQHFIIDCKTIDEAIRRSVQLNGREKECLAFRRIIGEEIHYVNEKAITKYVLSDYNWITYGQFDDRVNHIGKGLLLNGVKPKDKVMIYAETSIDWFICAQSILRIGSTVATLYSTLNDEGVIHGLNETEVTHVITSHSLLPKLIKLQKYLTNVTKIIYIDGFKSPSLEKFDSNKVTLISLSELEEMGKCSTTELIEFAPSEEDIAVVLYTSGSTGIPKGVIISHKNFIRAASSYISVVKNIMNSIESHVYIGYLPLAHILEFATETFLFIIGVKIGYSTPYTLTDTGTAIRQGDSGDATLLRPTLMAAVPLVLDRIRKGIYDKINRRGLIARKLFDFAIDYKTYWTERGFNTTILNYILCRKLRALVGGRITIMLVGGAPLSQDTQKLIKACLNITLAQGYASTETTGAGAIMDENDHSFGRVGAPLYGVKMKLIDWDEGGYRVSDSPNPRGEIVIGSDAISLGYFKLDETTKESYYFENGDKWFLTGDIGEVFPNGTFKIIDRKKDLIKLQLGEYVSLGKVEAELKNCIYIDNICVVGNSYHNYLVALIVPNLLAITKLAKRLKIIDNSNNDLCENNEIVSAISNQIERFGKNAKLNKIEIPVKIKLCSEEWTPDNGLVTAAMKIKRKNIVKKYQTDIDSMYNSLDNN